MGRGTSPRPADLLGRLFGRGGESQWRWWLLLATMLVFLSVAWWHVSRSADQQERAALRALDSARSDWVERSREKLELTSRLLASQADLIVSGLVDPNLRALESWLAVSLLAEEEKAGCLLDANGGLLAFSGLGTLPSEVACRLEPQQLEQSARGDWDSTFRLLEGRAHWVASAPVVDDFELRAVVVVIRPIDVGDLLGRRSVTPGELLVLVRSEDRRMLVAASLSLPQSAALRVPQLWEVQPEGLFSTLDVAGEKFRMQATPWQGDPSESRRWVALTPALSRGFWHPLVQLVALVGIVVLALSLAFELRTSRIAVRRTDRLCRNIERLSTGEGELSGSIGGWWERPRRVVSEVAMQIAARQSLADRVLQVTKRLGPARSARVVGSPSEVKPGAVLAIASLRPGYRAGLVESSVVAAAGGVLQGSVGLGWWSSFEGDDGGFRALAAAAALVRGARSPDLCAVVGLAEGGSWLDDLARLVTETAAGEFVLSSGARQSLSGVLDRANVVARERPGAFAAPRGALAASRGFSLHVLLGSDVERLTAGVVAVGQQGESRRSRLPELSLGASVAARYLIAGGPAAGLLSVEWLARDLEKGSAAVVRWLKTPVWSDPVDDQRARRALERCRRLRHPNVVRVEEVLRLEDGLFVVTEWVPGPTLRELLSLAGPLAELAALELAIALCKALTAAHAVSVCHHDLCPENVIFEPSGIPKLAGFGVAPPRLRQRGRAEDGGLLVGGAAYLAPEQVEGPVPGFASDLYSLGAVLFEAIVGRAPFEAKTTQEILAQHLVRSPSSLRTFVPEVSPELDELVLKCLAKNPDERFASAEDVRQRLEQIRYSSAQFPRASGVSWSGGAGARD